MAQVSFLFFFITSADECKPVNMFFFCIYNNMKEMYKTPWHYTASTLSTDTI